MPEVVEVILLFIVRGYFVYFASLNGHVLGSAKILGNSYCYCRGEKQK